MADGKEFLQTAYQVETVEQTRDFYQDWAKTYDSEIAENRYVTPARCATALAEFVLDKSAPLLDIGCGTGLSGEALTEAGFTTIDGCDLSSEMLGQAHARDVYRKLHEIDPDEPFPFHENTYTNIAAVGVIAPSHAPAELIDQALGILPSGGLFVFSLNDHSLEDPSFSARIAENFDTGQAILLFKEHGDHLLGIALMSTVYVMQKL